VPWALDDSARNHGPNGSLDLIGNLLEYGDPGFRYDTRGWPDFPFWPNARQKTHTGYYHKWIERAWLSGMRMNITLLVENQVLCLAQSTINPAGWLPKNSCDTMDSIRLQAKRVYEMQDYIDAQAGGPGKGFFRVVTSPVQARQVIADGKLAVVMGVEASETLNCGVRDYCDISKIEQGLNELYQLGIRAIFPAHKSDNQLSGGKVENGFVNLGQALAAGHYFETKRCDEHTRGKALDSELPVIGEVPLVNDLLNQVGASPEYEDHDDHCNTHALTPFGVYLVNRMIDLNMIIDLDHLSADAISQVMDIVEARNYSGVVSSHSFCTTPQTEHCIATSSVCSMLGGLQRTICKMPIAPGQTSQNIWMPYSKRHTCLPWASARIPQAFPPSRDQGTSLATRWFIRLPRSLA